MGEFTLALNDFMRDIKVLRGPTKVNQFHSILKSIHA